jgi:hypothetical protein
VTAICFYKGEGEMTDHQYEEIKQFAANLSKLRVQVSDKGLLDTCQDYLNQLLELSKAVPLDPV